MVSGEYRYVLRRSHTIYFWSYEISLTFTIHYMLRVSLYIRKYHASTSLHLNSLHLTCSAETNLQQRAFYLIKN